MKKITIEKVLAAMVFLAMCCVLVVGPCAIIGFENSLEVYTTQPEVKERMEDDKSVEVNLYEGKSSTAYLASHKESGEANPNDMDDAITEPTECVEVWEAMYVSVNHVKVYAEPNVDSNIVTICMFTDKIEVSSESETEGWTKIKFGELYGFVPNEKQFCMEKDEFLNIFQHLLAQAVMSEAGGVGSAEMARCGEVMLNRVNTNYWEFAKQTSLAEVLRASGQYPTTWRKIQNGLVPSNKAWAVAEALLVGTCDIYQYFSPEEYERLEDVEKQELKMLEVYEEQFTDDVLWQTGFYPCFEIELEVVYKSYCGNGYYHYYSRLPG